MSQDFYFLLMPGFSAIGFISALEPLRVANRFRGELYRWHVLSADGGAVLASNGMSVNADAALEPLKKARPCWWWPASSRCSSPPRAGALAAPPGP
jgi:AraC family carnitine catabolism transcriptional activator